MDVVARGETLCSCHHPAHSAAFHESNRQRRKRSGSAVEARRPPQSQATQRLPGGDHRSEEYRKRAAEEAQAVAAQARDAANQCSQQK